MEIKCLVVFNNKNYLLFLNGNYLKHFIEALNNKKELNQLICDNIQNYDFFIFEEDFKTYVQLDEDLLIKNLSKVLIKNKNDNSLLLIKNQVSIKNEQNLINDSTAGFLNNMCFSDSFKNCTNDLDYSKKREDFDINDKFLVQESHSSNNHYNNQANVLKYDFRNKLKIEGEDKNNQLNNFKANVSNNKFKVEWTEDDIFCLLECCKLFSEEFIWYDISVNIDDVKKKNFYLIDLLWDKISLKVRKFTSKPFNKLDCELKFSNLRTTYKNLISNTSIENTYFFQLKYFNQLKQLIDNSNSDMNSESFISNLKPDYIALIKQVEINNEEFKGQKNIAWEKISNILKKQGFNLEYKYCQNLFYRLRLKYLEILNKVSSEGEGELKWPYFKYFKNIDLSPFCQLSYNSNSIKTNYFRKKRLLKRRNLN